MKKKRKNKSLIVGFVLCIIVLFLLLYFGNKEIKDKSHKFIFSSKEIIKSNPVGLILGTSKYLSNGDLNPYFKNRIDAAYELFKANKIRYIIVSGDNHDISYNEPIRMKKELVKSGVPDSLIYLDYAGFRTFDSVIRCREIFGQDSFTIISQRFHLERAIYISHHFKINAIGFEAKDVGFSMGLKTRLREYFARLKVFIDIYTGEKPYFLGEKVNINKPQ